MKQPSVRAAVGYVKPSHPGFRRIVVSFEEDVFEEIQARAVKRGQSFAAAVRDLVEFGLWEEGDAKC